MTKTIRDIPEKIHLSVPILILSVSAVIAYGYFSRVDRPSFELRLERHNQIIAGTAPSPYRYRVLVPFMVEGLIRGLTNILSSRAASPLYAIYGPHVLAATKSAAIGKVAFLVSYAIYDLLAVFLLLSTLFSWLREWFSKEQALVGVLFVAGTMPIALQDHDFQPWSLLEVGFFTGALIAIHRRRYGPLALLVGLASLNRETAVFIPLAFLLMDSDMPGLCKTKSRTDWRPLLLFGGSLLVWGVVFLGLRCLRGSAPHLVTIEGVLARNTTTAGLFYAVINGSLFLGGFWVFAILGLKYAPHPIRRAVLVVPPYLVAIMLLGVWYEVRLLMPLYPVFVPLALAFVYHRQGSKNNADT